MLTYEQAISTLHLSFIHYLKSHEIHKGFNWSETHLKLSEDYFLEFLEWFNVTSKASELLSSSSFDVFRSTPISEYAIYILLNNTFEK